MAFEAPYCLLLAAVALLPWLRLERLTHADGAKRDPRHCALRSLALLCVVIAMARPVQIASESRVSHALVWDRSASVSAEGDRAARELLDEQLEELLASHPDGALSVLEISGGDAAGRPAWEAPSSVAVTRFPVDAGSPTSTPLATAIVAAVRRRVPGAMHAVTVLSDGLGRTPGSALRELSAEVAESGVSLAFARIAGVAGDLRLTGARLLGDLRAGTSADVWIALEGAGQVVDLTIRSEGSTLARVEGVRVDGAVEIPVGIEPEHPGFLEASIQVTVVEGVDPRDGDLSLSKTLAVQAPRQLLYFGDRVDGGAERLAELIGGGFDVIDAFSLPGLAGGDASDLSSLELGGNDLIVIDDCPATRMPARLQEKIRDAVQEKGVGLVMSGGEAAFGPGGYHESPLEEILPVEFVQKEEKRDPSTTLVVIIDTSGSMGGNRVQLAKEVSRLAIRRLLPHDKVGLVEFYGAKRWAVPIQPASNSIEIERALNRLDAGGGTVILPAIEEAYYGLKNVTTRYKHVLILTDGGVETGSFEPLLRRMADDGMTVSTVLIGPDAHSEFLVNIANWGQGRFYSVPNRFNLPEILLKQPASAKLPSYRPGTIALEAPARTAAWWGEVDVEAGVPDLDGYVESRLRPGAESVLETAEEHHPIVASWRHGLGRVTAMMTEPTGPGTESWRSWAGYGEFLTRVLERTAADAGAPFAYRLSVEGAEALLVAERRAGAGEVEPSAQSMDSDLLDSEPVVWERVAPDRFEARLPFVGPPGGSSPSLRIVAGAAALPAGGSGSGAGPTGQRLRRAATLLVQDAGPGELQVPSAHADDLAALARWSQRQLASRTGETREAPPGEASRLRELAPLFALLALLLYLADILYRRWPTRTLL